MDTMEIELFDKEEMEDFKLVTNILQFALFCEMIVCLGIKEPVLWILMNLGV